MTELRKLEGQLKSILPGVKSRDGGRKRAMVCLQLIKWRLDEAGIDPSLTRPLQDVLDAFEEADRGIQHPLFAPAPLKGRPRASPTQFGVMITAARAIDLYMAAGKRREEAARLVAKELKKNGVQIGTNGPMEKAILQWRHELTKAGRGQGLGRTKGEWHSSGSLYLLERDVLMKQVKEGTLNAEAEAARFFASFFGGSALRFFEKNPSAKP